MASVGLTLRWEHRISPEGGEGASGVQSAEIEGRSNPTGAATPEDAALAAGCLAGEMRAYERLYSAQGVRMRNLARNLLGSQPDAEDAVQETFLKIQRSISTFRGQSSFVTWAFRILVNTCYDMRRSKVRRKEQSNDDSEESAPREPRAPGAHPTLRMALERALAELTEQQRNVFLLYEVEGFRHSEIANMLEISETASKNTLFQAKRNLRGMLEPPRDAEAGGAR
ncbi:MAG TPA: RNA polymerase sigma factor [Candidatus Saccharimonadales bacterium]|nr:RNA polymerase sigma factor [Candidatus Saccharimonadales bacterium]